MPTSGAVLGWLLSPLETDHSLKYASGMATDEVKAVWMHHFGSRLVMGKHYGTEDEDIVDSSLKMIKSDQHEAGKVTEL